MDVGKLRELMGERAFEAHGGAVWLAWAALGQAGQGLVLDLAGWVRGATRAARRQEREGVRHRERRGGRQIEKRVRTGLDMDRFEKEVSDECGVESTPEN